MRIGLIQIIEDKAQPRRGEIFIANNQDNKPQPRRGGIIIKYNTFVLTRRIVALDSGLKLITKFNYYFINGLFINELKS